MKKKTVWQLCLQLTCFTLACDGYALPKDQQISAGTAEFQQIDSHTMEIRPSDQAIINYAKFDIGFSEKVRFIQNSLSSCVLNRVKGSDPSQIFGSLESNGKVFLVNPNGIYFGPKSQVNVGSLIASTLDIADVDFLKGNYHFFLNKASEIRSEGNLTSLEGSIVLMAPKIQNLGSIQAKAGTVLLASGQHVTLDFVGDGLIQFSVEGTLKEALIEHLGEIKGSIVALKLPTAKKAIQEIVNLDEMQEGDVFVEENGIIKFAPTATIIAQKTFLEASQLSVEGSIEAEEVHIFGKDIALTGAQIDASTPFGGGEVLIGGEYQGKGTTPYASTIIMDGTSQILANALESGDGGLVVLWSKDVTLFDGAIEAKGGSLGGKGGLVETSSKGDLQIKSANVNTLSVQGTAGEWLLDPDVIIISSTGTVICTGSGGVFGSCISPTSGTCTILPSSFSGVSTNISLNANFAIEIEDSFSLSGVSGFTPNLTLTICNPSPSPFVCSIGNFGSSDISIVTDGGDLTFPTYNILFSDASITTNGGAVNLPNISSNDSSFSLSIDTGGGIVTINTITPTDSNGEYLDTITIFDAASIETTGLSVEGELVMTGLPLVAVGSSAVNINTTANGALGGNIQVGSIDGNSSSTPIIMAAGSGVITIGGEVGGSIAPLSFTIESASNVVLANNITTAGGEISITPSLTLQTDSVVTSNNGNITFEGTFDLVNEGTSLTIDAGTGSVSIATLPQPLGDVSITGSTVTLEGAVDISGDLIIANSGLLTIDFGTSITDVVNVAGAFDQTASGSTILGTSISANQITFTGAVTVDENLSLISTEALTFAQDVTGSGTQDLILISYLDVVDAQNLGTTLNPLGSLLLTATGDYSSFTGIAAEGAIDIAAPVQLNTNPTVVQIIGGESSSNSLTFENTIDATVAGIQALTITAGSNYVVFSGDLGATIPLGAVTVSGSQLQLGSSIYTKAGAIDITSPILLTATSTLNAAKDSVAGADITIPALTALDAYDLTLTTGTAGSISTGSIGASSQYLGTTSIAGSGVVLGGIVYTDTLSIANSGVLSIQLGNVFVTDSFQQTGAGTTDLGNNITASVGTISFAGSIVLTADVTLTSLAGMTLSDTIDGDFNLTLNGNFSFVTLGDLFGSGTPLQSLTITSSFVNVNGGGTAVDSITISPPSNITLTSDTTFTAADISISAGTTPGSIDATSAGSQSLTLSATGTVFLGPAGFNTPLGAVEITAPGGFTVWGIETAGALIDITGATTLGASSVTLDTTGDSATGADIDFSSTVDGAGSLIMKAGSVGVITFPGAVGGTTRLTSLSIESASLVNTKNVKTTGSINIVPSIILSNTTTTFSSNRGGAISLGSIDGTAAGSQSLDVVTTGAVALGVIGNSICLNNVTVATGTAATIHSILVSGLIEIDIPIVLAASSTIDTTGNGSSGSTLTLQTVTGTTVGGENLTLITGTGDVVFAVNVGTAPGNPIGNLDVTANLITFEGSSIINKGSQVYHDPVQISQSITLTSFGDITFDSTVSPVSGTPSFTLYPGSSAVTFTGAVTGFAAVAVFNAGSFSAQAITAGALVVSGGQPSIFLEGVVTLSTPGALILNGGPINLGAEIDAQFVALNAQGNISNIGAPVPINISGTNTLGFDIFNAVGGVIGSLSSPIEVNTSYVLLVGASPRADFIGTPFHSTVRVVPSNIPCIVTFNGVTLISDCVRVKIQNIFNNLPKYLFYVPGLYSSWDNLSNREYFEQEPVDISSNPEYKKLFYQIPKRPTVEETIHRSVEEKKPAAPPAVKKTEEIPQASNPANAPLAESIHRALEKNPLPKEPVEVVVEAPIKVEETPNPAPVLNKKEEGSLADQIRRALEER